MANIPEFISVLRKIRDEIYPEVEATYENALILKAAIEAGQIQLDKDLTSFGADFATFISKSIEIEDSVEATNLNALSAANNASSAALSAATVTTKSNEIKGISTQAVTLSSGSSATSSYNPVDGKFTFGIPTGAKGDKGDSFTVNAVGLTAGRSAYNTQATGFSYLDVSLALIYFKLSSTSGDWSVGAAFGKGDKGDTGTAGNGIYDIKFKSTTHVSGLASQSGGLDTYRVTLTNSNTYHFVVKNGIDLDDSKVVHKAGAEIITGQKTYSLDILGNVSTATKLKTARAITLTGGVTGTGNFDGSGNLDIVTTVNVTSFQRGMIILWSGSTASIPSGWVLCDGSNNTPNLTNRFVIGAGSSYAVGATGGSADAVVVAHSHTASTNSAGVHTHTFPRSSYDDGTNNIVQAGTNESVLGNYATSSAGAHSHTVSVASAGASGTGANIPPYYALAYIMKT